MKKKTGFTLVELLVVISIIALLMSILMPSLRKARESAKDVVCLSNLRQWGVVWSMYTGDHDGNFHGGRYRTDSDPDYRPSWIEILESYYKDKKVLLCPSATKPAVPTGVMGVTVLGDKRHAWGVFQGTSGNNWDIKDTYGSYGINSWVCNPPSGKHAYNPNMYWRRVDVRKAAEVPLMGDCWFISGWPNSEYPGSLKDEPPAYDGHKDTSPPGETGRFCLDRHNERINMVFLDSSVRKVSLKELWRLKWHPNYVNSGRKLREPRWPDWMKKFRD